ncbi:MAG: hypothetical protein EA343_24535 [Nodularia sp. (in: Bacteria)]|nr:MAG: hypothetical protein EA343_24535 [Nodularia sp. (in: cyanobacteria)]
MSKNNTSKIKFILSILAITSVAALNPAAYAQNIKPGNVDNFLTRANLNPNSSQLQRRDIDNVPSAVEKLPDGFKPNGAEDKFNVVCNGSCGKKPNAEELKKNPINPNDSIRQLPQRQIRRQ